jgi:hypothetical protein
MSAIKELSRDIANLQKVQYLLQRVKGWTYGDQVITQTAYFIRGKFDLVEQRWRDLLSKNDFFFFSYPKFAVYDGIFLTALSLTTRRLIKRTLIMVAYS